MRSTEKSDGLWRTDCLAYLPESRRKLQKRLGEIVETDVLLATGRTGIVALCAVCRTLQEQSERHLRQRSPHSCRREDGAVV